MKIEVRKVFESTVAGRYGGDSLQSSSLSGTEPEQNE